MMRMSIAPTEGPLTIAGEEPMLVTALTME
jgi:hypothetical protein